MKSTSPPCPVWSCASDQDSSNYIDLVHQRLQRLTIPDSLRRDDPLCDDLSHSGCWMSCALCVVEWPYTTIPRSRGGKVQEGFPDWGGGGAANGLAIPMATHAYSVQKCLALAPFLRVKKNYRSHRIFKSATVCGSYKTFCQRK